VAVTAGRHDQNGFRYEITEVRDDGWSFRHDRAGTFVGIEISTRSTEQALVEEAHARLSAPGEGRFAKVLVVQHRDESGIDTVRGCLWHRIEPDRASQTELASYDDWRAALVDGARLSLEGVDDGELRALYAAQWDKHLAWTAAGRP
jgi:hypothetical protein